LTGSLATAITLAAAATAPAVSRSFRESPQSHQELQ